MPLFDHLRELRNRVAKMALALAAGMQKVPLWAERRLLRLHAP
jgi:hypothetical protein